MGADWVYFTHYEIKPDDDLGDDIIHYQNGGSFSINFLTSSFLGTVLEHFGVLLPVYDEMEPPSSKILSLVDPKLVEIAATKAIELLQQSLNPQVKSSYLAEEYTMLFDDSNFDEHHSVQSWNERILSYLKDMVQLSKDGHFFVRCMD
jgi:hypothetical protein